MGGCSTMHEALSSSHFPSHRHFPECCANWRLSFFFSGGAFFRPPVRHLFCYIFSLSELAFRNIDDEDEHFMFVLALSVLPYQTLCWESQSNSSLTGSGLINVSPAPASVCILYDFFFSAHDFSSRTSVAPPIIRNIPINFLSAIKMQNSARANIVNVVVALHWRF